MTERERQLTRALREALAEITRNGACDFQGVGYYSAGIILAVNVDAWQAVLDEQDEKKTPDPRMTP